MNIDFQIWILMASMPKTKKTVPAYSRILTKTYQYRYEYASGNKSCLAS